MVQHTFILADKSTPKSAAVFLSNGFFFAFIMLGSVAYLGSFKRKSADTTAGSFSLTVSKPPSISRTTLRPSPSFSTCKYSLLKYLDLQDYKCEHKVLPIPLKRKRLVASSKGQQSFALFDYSHHL